MAFYPQSSTESNKNIKIPSKQPPMNEQTKQSYQTRPNKLRCRSNIKPKTKQNRHQILTPTQKRKQIRLLDRLYSHTLAKRGGVISHRTGRNLYTR